MANKTQTIKLLSKNYEIKCPEAEITNLQEAAAKLNEQLLQHKKKFKNLNDFQYLLLSSLHICHELISCQKQQQQQRHHVTEFINSLETKINQTVKGASSIEDIPQTD